MKKSTILTCALFAFCSVAFAQNVIRVSDFGAVPNDGKCDRDAIAKALSAAAKVEKPVLEFDSGVYDLFVADLNNEVCIAFSDIKNLTIKGAVDDKGRPATELIRNYKMKFDVNANRILYAQNCPNLTVKNIVFDNKPQYMACGEVVENDGQSIIIKVPEGLPYVDGSRAYCGNIWDKKTGNLVVGKGSFSFGGAVDNMPDLTLRFHGDPKDRLLKMDSPRVAKVAKVGEIISWNFGWLGYQVIFSKCDNLRVENVWTHSAIGFCMQASYCRNVTAKGVKFIKREGSRQMHVGSRDAWKLFSCKGVAIIEDMYVEGVRWDGQNVHGIFAWPYEIIDKNTAIFSNDLYGISGGTFFIGSKVGFFKDKDTEVFLTVKSVEELPTQPAGKIVDYGYGKEANMDEPQSSKVALSQNLPPKNKKSVKVTFEEEIPDFVNGSTICNLYGLNLESYLLINSTFRNIAGCASLIRNDDVNIVGNTFDHIMYPAVCIGGALAEVEGVISKNAYVANNTFIACGWQDRHGASAALSAKVQLSKRTPRSMTPYMRNINASGNTFIDCPKGIEMSGVDGLYIYGNTFINTKKPIDEYGNKNVNIQNNIPETVDDLM